MIRLLGEDADLARVERRKIIPTNDNRTDMEIPANVCSPKVISGYKFACVCM